MDIFFVSNIDMHELDERRLKRGFEDIIRKFGSSDTISTYFLNDSANKPVMIVSSPLFKTDRGEDLVQIKNAVIDLFDQNGIRLEKDNFRVKAQLIPEEQKAHLLKKTGRKLNGSAKTETEPDEEFDYEKKSKQYVPVEPLYSFDRVILSEDTLRKITEAVGILEYENKVFNEWGLYEIQPHPSTALSFYGPSGTGKTMAAEAIAKKLDKKILRVSYADVESKYHGEGPKMVKAIFLAAQNNDAVLFFDEADSLLSKRLTNVSSGSDQAINSMRSQLLICLEEFRGIVIFATNLVANYDKAFLTRLISVEFKFPEAEVRKKIWDVHIKPVEDGKSHQLNIPLAFDVDTQELSEKYELAGRKIRNAVVSACVSAAMNGSEIVKQSDFIKACDMMIAEEGDLAKSRSKAANDKANEILKTAIQDKIKEKKGS